MLACPSSTLHGPVTLHHHSQPSKFLLSKPLLFPPRSRFASFGKFKFRSLFSGSKNRHGFGVRASLDSSSQASESLIDIVVPHITQQPYSVKIPVGDRHILVETSHIGRQASGSVTVTDGETVMHTAATKINSRLIPSLKTLHSTLNSKVTSLRL